MSLKQMFCKHNYIYAFDEQDSKGRCYEGFICQKCKKEKSIPTFKYRLRLVRENKNQ